LVHLGLIFSDAEYSIIAPTCEKGPILWTNQTAPGRAPIVLDEGTTAQLSAVRHSWEEAVLTYRMFNMVQQALKKKIITVFDPLYLDILNDDMVGFANITAREMLDHLFLIYGNITAVDLDFFLADAQGLGSPSASGDLIQANSILCYLLGGRRNNYWPPIANQRGLRQDFCHRQFHQRLPQMEQEGHC
jgi:hypothetical protein